MTFFLAMVMPLVDLALANKWTILCFFGLYLILSFIFRRARAAVTIIFGVVALLFILSNVGTIWDLTKETLTQVQKNAEVVSSEYADYVNDNIISNNSLPLDQKINQMIEFGVLGRRDENEVNAPNEDSSQLPETIQKIVDAK